MKRVLKVLLVTFLSFLFVSSVSAGNTTLISGSVVSKDNKPIKGAYVYAYKSTSKGQMGPSDFISNPTNEHGEFSFNAGAGEYYIIARKRADESNVGVLSTGDYASPTGFKLTIAEGSATKITLIVEQIVEPMFFKKTGSEITDTGVKGVILDERGGPVPGAFAIAYKDKGMKTLPDFASVPAQADGSYTLFFPDAGTYYIGARINTKRPPVKGELYGLYDKNEDHSVEAKKGTFLENINITLKPFTGTITTDFKGFE